MGLPVWNPLDELSWLQESLDISRDDLLGGSSRPARRLATLLAASRRVRNSRSALCVAPGSQAPKRRASSSS